MNTIKKNLKNINKVYKMVYENTDNMVSNLTDDLLELKILIEKIKNHKADENMVITYNYMTKIYNSNNLIEIKIAIYKELEKIDRFRGIYNNCYSNLIRSLKADYNIA